MVENNFFPKKFDFFSVGQINQKNISKNLLTQIAATVVFKIKGEENGLCAVCFENFPTNKDTKVTPLSFEKRNSMIIELSNVLVSKFVNSMSEYFDAQIEISPPMFIQHEEFKFRHLFGAIRNAVLNPKKNDVPNTKVKTYTFGNKKNYIRLALIYIHSPEGQS